MTTPSHVPASEAPTMQEVGRLRLPLPARDMTKLSDYLTLAYGPDVFMRQDGEWMVLE